MSSKSYKDEGIVLARRSYGEADRILIIFTKNKGKQSLVAKGVRKPKSRKRGSLEVFSQIRFQAVRTRGLAIMTEVEAIDSFSSLRKNLKKVSVAYFMIEVVGRVTRDNEESRQLYNLLLTYLKKVGEETKLKNLRHEFTKKVLVVTGFWPHDKSMPEPDLVLEAVVEREITSIRVGKKITV